MKSLVLVRHAKSSWSDFSLDDHERPLNGRGERDAPKMGRILAEREYVPDLMVTSTAVRARTTCRIIARELGYSEESIIEEPGIYHAGTHSLLQIVAHLDEAASSAMLFGHNPGFHDLVNTLVAGAPVDHFPTCAVARMRLDIDHWGAVSDACGTLEEYLFPKQFG